MKRNIWPYAIIGYFVVFITGMVAWIAFAIRNDDELVRYDYYEHEIEYQRQIDRVARTRKLASSAEIFYVAAAKTLFVALPKEHVASRGTIHLYRASNAMLDQEFGLKLHPDGTQTIDVAGFEEGQWKVLISWSVGEEEYYLERAVFF